MKERSTFQRVDLETFEIGKRRVANAKIVAGHESERPER
jgi:hypothetical protein